MAATATLPPLPPPLQSLTVAIPSTSFAGPLDANGAVLAVDDRVILASSADNEYPADRVTGCVVRCVQRNVIEVKYDSTGLTWRCAAKMWIKVP